MDALAEFNTTPPLSRYTREQAFANPNILSLLCVGAARNVVRTLVADYAANGWGQTVNEFQIENKFSDYQSLLSSLDSAWKERLEPFKTASEKHIRGMSSLNKGSLLRQYPWRINRWFPNPLQNPFNMEEE